MAWLFERDFTRFSDVALTRLKDAQSCISPVVLLELQYLFERGRVREPAEVFRRELQSTLNLEVCALPFERVIRKACEQSWTRDPFDRLIASHALERDWPLLTKDRLIRTHCPQAVW